MKLRELIQQPISGKRFLIRLLAFVLSLIVLDLAARLIWGPALQVAYQDHYRLPENQETPLLNDYLDAIRSSQPTANTAAKKRILFLGSSPTYGVSIKDPAMTYPASFERALRADSKLAGRDTEVYNLAAKGYLMSDIYYLEQAIVEASDLMVLQLNYHTFAPQLLAGTAIRHPELPEQLGVGVSEQEAKGLGLRPTPRINLTPPLSNMLRKYWFLYGKREALAHLWLNDTAESWLYHRFFPDPKQEAEQEGGSAEPFYELNPARQTFMVKRYAQNVDFELAEDNLELAFLERSLQSIKAHHKPCLVFMAPINIEALNFYKVFNPQQYDRNLALIRSKVEAQGCHWMDINRSAPLAEDYFADISHTLDAGGAIFGAHLYQSQQGLIRKVLETHS